MLFNSQAFLFLFLPITLVLYFIARKFRWVGLSLLVLVAASIFYYGYWKPLYLIVLLFSVMVNYAVSLYIGNRAKSKWVFVFGVVFNLALLSIFKYSNFFIDNINAVAGTEFGGLSWALPLGISFFSFQQISFLADCNSGKLVDRSFLRYLLYVSFFPQLIAGPIVHHSEMMPQFADSDIGKPNFENLSKGLFLLALGLFKKVILADNLSPIVKQGFDVLQSLTWVEAWISTIAYTFQLYFDFSGYSDMAIGIALFFNISLPVNFKSPYKSLNIREFWQRWHITLSRFLRDYIYIPLGGNRTGRWRTMLNLMITFLLGGLWHGAAWTFVFWGLLHGSALVFHRSLSKLKMTFPPWLSIASNFLFVAICWIFFRATSWKSAWKVFSADFNPAAFSTYSWNTIGSPSLWKDIFIPQLALSSSALSILFVGFIVVFMAPGSHQLAERFKTDWYYSGLTVFLFLCAALNLDSVSEFIYYQF